MISLGWLLLGIGLGVLLVLYLKGVFRRKLHYKIYNVPEPTASNFAFTLAGLSDSRLSQAENTGFWLQAEAIQTARLEAIRSAKRLIQFETYKMTPGKRADLFAMALTERALAGVKVQLIADSHGSHKIPKKYWHQLKLAGVEIRFFNRFSWRAPTDNLKRNHRKLLIIDDETVLIGGAGISDDWDGVEEQNDTEPWLDFEVRFQGSIVPHLQSIFIQHWLDCDGTADLADQSLSHSVATHQPLVLITPGEAPSHRDSAIRALSQVMIQAAQKQLWIGSPYFIPQTNTRQLLIEAKRRGVDVRILTMGPSNDKNYVYYAAREMYKDLLLNQVNIYEYQPSMMHSKVMLVDQKWVVIGSGNVDPRSFLLNDELNLSTSQPQLRDDITQFFENAFTKSQCICLQNWKSRPVKQRCIGQTALLFKHQL
ncbi:MAG: phospholipase D-like domain-containing protein [Microcoleaceae cyanobacterium]